MDKDGGLEESHMEMQDSLKLIAKSVSLAYIMLWKLPKSVRSQINT